MNTETASPRTPTPTAGMTGPDIRCGEYWIAGQSEDRTSSYVRWAAPARDAAPLPIVLVHGGGGQSTDWTTTPDGQPGWAPQLISAGYEVHLPDRPAHGRSPYRREHHGETAPPAGPDEIATLFAPPATDPRHTLHTQWPWERHTGGPQFDVLVASAQPMLRDVATSHRLDTDMLVSLLQRVGRSVVITHSAGAPAGWLAAERHPELVAALVAVEPMGPPWRDLGARGSLAFGLTAIAPRTDTPSAGTRPFDELARVPVAIVSADASGRYEWDRASAQFLRDSGVTVDHIYLPDHDIHGHGHGLIYEMGNDRVLDLVRGWFENTVRPRPHLEGTDS